MYCRRRWGGWMGALAALLVCLAGCASKKQSSALVGTWKNTDVRIPGVTPTPAQRTQIQQSVSAMALRYTFTSDGSFTVAASFGSPSIGTWEADGQTLKIRQSGKETSYAYRLEDGGTTLVTKEPRIGTDTVFTRQ